jgi:hypothetical protein
MLIKKYNSIMERDESHRNKWAVGLSITISAFIFLGWAFYKDFIHLEFVGNGTLVGKTAVSQEARAVSAVSPLSPIDNSKETFKAAFMEIEKRYATLKESITDVLVRQLALFEKTNS